MVRVLYHIVRADFLERIRRYHFFVSLALLAVLVYVYLPPANAAYTTFIVGSVAEGSTGYRGIYNSAWVGSTVATLTTTFLSLIGFFLLKNTIERDTETGVGQILATTPLSKTAYTVGKWLSNVAVLGVMIGVTIIVALGMQLVRGEDRSINLWALIAPFLLLTTPALLVTAALAVLFETVQFLRKGLGNILYFILWITVVSVSTLVNAPVLDLLGISVLTPAMEASVHTAVPSFTGSGISTGIAVIGGNLHTFVWDGPTWNGATVLWRCEWLLVAIALAVFAALPFNRFDTTHALRRKNSQLSEAMPVPVIIEQPIVVPNVRLTLSPVQPARSVFGRVLGAELRLLLKRAPLWWLFGLGALVVAALFVPLDASRHYLAAISLIWPVLVWSEMGGRERMYRTEQIVFSAAFPVRRQLPAAWIAGVIVALAAVSGVLVRLCLAGDIAGMLALCVGALFVPALALATGVWGGSGKIFQVVYLLLWYVGVLQGLRWLDFAGVTAENAAVSIPVYFGAVLVLLALSALGRHQQRLE
ncbi:MAG: hypothetical protein H7Z42_13920 [Roseiflexaceae bacterium]|nr:hypothetical protein [Roseiflexaceae bacterium]